MMMAASSSVQTASCRVTGARRGTVSRSAHAASSATARASGFVGGVRLPARAARRGAVSSGAWVARAQRLHRGAEGSLRSRAHRARRSTVSPRGPSSTRDLHREHRSRPANRLREGAEPSNHPRARRPARHLANIRALWRWRAPHTDDPARLPFVSSPPLRLSSRPGAPSRRDLPRRRRGRRLPARRHRRRRSRRRHHLRQGRCRQDHHLRQPRHEHRRLGYRVCLVDADIGLRNLDLLLGLENRVMYTAMEVLEGECRMEQALIRDKRWRSPALLPHLEESPKVQRDQGFP